MFLYTESVANEATRAKLLLEFDRDLARADGEGFDTGQLPTVLGAKNFGEEVSAFEPAQPVIGKGDAPDGEVIDHEAGLAATFADDKLCTGLELASSDERKIGVQVGLDSGENDICSQLETERLTEVCVGVEEAIDLAFGEHDFFFAGLVGWFRRPRGGWQGRWSRGRRDGGICGLDGGDLLFHDGKFLRAQNNRLDGPGEPPPKTTSNGDKNDENNQQSDPWRSALKGRRNDFGHGYLYARFRKRQSPSLEGCFWKPGTAGILLISSDGPCWTDLLASINLRS